MLVFDVRARDASLQPHARTFCPFWAERVTGEAQRDTRGGGELKTKMERDYDLLLYKWNENDSTQHAAHKGTILYITIRSRTSTTTSISTPSGLHERQIKGCVSCVCFANTFTGGDTR